jgi:transposase
MRNSYFFGTMFNCGNYNDNFRRKVALLAVETADIPFVAETIGVSKGSVYRWLKAYDLFKQYAAKKHNLAQYPQASFIRKSEYDNNFRQTVVQYAMRTNTIKAADRYAVSVGSVDNWIKAFQGNTTYLNRG